MKHTLRHIPEKKIISDSASSVFISFQDQFQHTYKLNFSIFFEVVTCFLIASNVQQLIRNDQKCSLLNQL